MRVIPPDDDTEQDEEDDAREEELAADDLVVPAEDVPPYDAGLVVLLVMSGVDYALQMENPAGLAQALLGFAAQT